MNILVVGAGAIGSLMGGKLAESGQAVTLVGRAPLVEAVRRQGLRLILGQETRVIRNVQAAGSIAEALQQAQTQEQPFDLAILTVKSYDTEVTLAELAQALESTGAPVPLLLSLQNGVGNEEAMAARFGPERVLAGTITAPVTVPEPGVVQVAKPKYVVGLSPWRPDFPAWALDSLCETLRAVGVTVTCYRDARSMKWTKLLMNMVGNASSAILDEPPDVVLADPRMADLEIDALREALAVMRALGIRPVNVEKYPLGTLAPVIRWGPRPLLRAALGRIVGGARGGKMPSLHMDLSKGKGKSEVEWLNGAVARHGEEAGVPTPVNRTLTQVLLHITRHPDAWDEWRHNHERLWQEARVRAKR